MNIENILEYRTLANCLSFSEAAYALNMNQSTLSKHIARIEASLGISLFDRHSYGISINNGGQIFHTYAIQILALTTQFSNYFLNHTENTFNKGLLYSLDFQYFREFDEVVRCHCLRKGANTLHIPVATISRHLRAIEKALGTPLYEKTGNAGICPNNMGTFFHGYVCELLFATDVCLKAITELRLTDNHLRIGICSSLPETAMNFVTEYCSTHPNASVTDYYDNPSTPTNHLLNKKCDICFIHLIGADKYDRFQQFIYSKGSFLAALPIGHPLCGHPELSLADLEKEPFYSYIFCSNIFKALDTASFYRLNTVCTSTHLDYILQQVSLGKGFSVVFNPSHTLAVDVAYIPLKLPATIKFSIVWRREKRSPALAAFIRAFQAHFS